MTVSAIHPAGGQLKDDVGVCDPYVSRRQLGAVAGYYTDTIGVHQLSTRIADVSDRHPACDRHPGAGHVYDDLAADFATGQRNPRYGGYRAGNQL